MHPLITAEGKRKRDFVLAAGKSSVQLLFKKNIFVTVLLSFAMTYIQIKVSLLALRPFL